jgi:hypothetical protein
MVFAAAGDRKPPAARERAAGGGNLKSGVRMVSGAVLAFRPRFSFPAKDGEAESDPKEIQKKEARPPNRHHTADATQSGGKKAEGSNPMDRKDGGKREKRKENGRKGTPSRRDGGQDGEKRRVPQERRERREEAGAAPEWADAGMGLGGEESSAGMGPGAWTGRA